MFHNVQDEYRAVIALKWVASESCIQLIALFTMPKMSKIMHDLFCENVKNHTTFVEGFWPEVNARGRLMKYSMSE